MTGAAAGQAGGAQAGGGGGGGGAGDGEAQGPVDSQGQPDLAALASTFADEKGSQAQLREQVAQLQEYLKSQPWAEGEPAGEDGDADDSDMAADDVDLSFLDDGDFMDDPTEMAEALADVFDRALGEQLKPLHQELASQRDAIAEQHQERQFEHLAAEIPALQDPEVAREVARHDVAHPFQLTAFPPHTTVYVVEKTTANEHTHALERTPDVRVSSATVARPPSELGEILATVVTDELGQATIAGLPSGAPNRWRSNGLGLPQRRYWAIGMVDGEWQRVSFSMKGT